MKVNRSEAHRHHPAIIIFHWIVALLIAFQMLLLNVLSPKYHIFIGILIGILMTLRLLVKFKYSNVPSEELTSNFMGKLAKSTHITIYVLVFLVIATGLSLAIEEDYFLSDTEDHKFLVYVLMAIIALHTSATLFHHLILKDKVFTRIWFR